MGQRHSGESQVDADAPYGCLDILELDRLVAERGIQLPPRSGLCRPDRSTLTTLLLAYDAGMGAGSGCEASGRAYWGLEARTQSVCPSVLSVLEKMRDAPGHMGVDIGGTLVKMALALPQEAAASCTFPQSFGRTGRTHNHLQFSTRICGKSFVLRFVSGSTSQMEQAVRHLAVERSRSVSKRRGAGRLSGSSFDAEEDAVEAGNGTATEVKAAGSAKEAAEGPAEAVVGSEEVESLRSALAEAFNTRGSPTAGDGSGSAAVFAPPTRGVESGETKEAEAAVARKEIEVLEKEDEKDEEEALAAPDALPLAAPALLEAPAMAEVKGFYRSDLKEELLPGELVFTANVSRTSLFRSLKVFFQGCDVKAEILKVDERAQTLNAAAFEDHILVDVEVRVEEALGDAAFSRAIFKHCSRSDAVRFERVFRLVVSGLRAAGIRVLCPTAPPGTALPRPCWEDFNIEDDDNDNFDIGDSAKIDWPVVFAPLFEQACCTQGWKCEEAAVLLATMASSSPACLVPLAEALAQRQEVLHQLLLSLPPLATQYPAAAMLSSISACKELSKDAASVLQSLVSQLLLSGVSPLVAKELTHALKNFSCI
mmetsp:Transcript_85209/g.190271  ORF Transcript_85209/g.190271 Transcript_85209/m.190271 type:complete len:596 (+) Transcript_85209:178-1965(+)